MRVTIYTDASRNDLCAWAFWARSDAGRIIENGLCPDDIQTVNEAEMFAILYAINAVRQDWPHTNRVLVKADNQHAIRLYEDLNKLSKVETEARMQRAFWELTKDLKRVRVEWVKAHTKKDTMQAYLNKQCDYLAKKARKRKERELLSSNQMI